MLLPLSSHKFYPLLTAPRFLSFTPSEAHIVLLDRSQYSMNNAWQALACPSVLTIRNIKGTHALRNTAGSVISRFFANLGMLGDCWISIYTQHSNATHMRHLFRSYWYFRIRANRLIATSLIIVGICRIEDCKVIFLAQCIFIWEFNRIDLKLKEIERKVIFSLAVRERVVHWYANVVPYVPPLPGLVGLFPAAPVTCSLLWMKGIDRYRWTVLCNVITSVKS